MGRVGSLECIFSLFEVKELRCKAAHSGSDGLQASVGFVDRGIQKKTPQLSFKVLGMLSLWEEKFFKVRPLLEQSLLELSTVCLLKSKRKLFRPPTSFFASLLFSVCFFRGITARVNSIVSLPWKNSILCKVKIRLLNLQSELFILQIYSFLLGHTYSR